MGSGLVREVHERKVIEEALTYCAEFHTRYDGLRRNGLWHAPVFMTAERSKRSSHEERRNKVMGNENLRLRFRYSIELIPLPTRCDRH